MKISITIVFSVKRPVTVRKYILCYTFIHKLMNNRQIYLADDQGWAADLQRLW